MRDNMDELKKETASSVDDVAAESKAVNNEEYSLNDDRRVKVLSPGTLVVKRFFRNRLAVLGMIMLIVMFVFSFIGGLVMPYRQDQIFYRHDMMKKEYVGVEKNDKIRYAVADGKEFGATAQAQFMIAFGKGYKTFSNKDVNYKYFEEGTDLWAIYSEDELIAIGYKDIVMTADGYKDPSFDLKYNALKAYTNGETAFSADSAEWTIDEDGSIIAEDGKTVPAYISRFVVQSKVPGTLITLDFKEKLAEAIEEGKDELYYTFAAGEGELDDDFIEDEMADENADGEEDAPDADGEAIIVEDEGATHFTFTYDALAQVWSVEREVPVLIKDYYSSPSLTHPLGTDGNGMDMLTRLMYGGRVSLVIGFIVVIIETVLGVIMGGIAGYFGGFLDNLIMRIVDVFYCIPTMPIIIIIGAAMDQLQLDPSYRMLCLMLVLGFLGWPGIARLVRGQILSLREQEFMTAAEASGISSFHRIFRHLIPNVIPQLIVSCTMGLGSVILTEATLSFLGLGVKFPFASWGNIISDVNNSYVMTTYWFIWIPAGICLLITVLGFNFVGDGLRDAFDPKMKR